jgi:hypothetical protein
LTITHPDFATLETVYYPYQPSLRLTLQPGAAVRLRVSLPGGRPASGFEFVLEGQPDGANANTHRAGVTDAAGECELRTLPPGSYIARYLGGADGPWAVPAIDVSGLAEGEQREIAVTAVAGSVLCGRVLEAETETPLHHAEVRFEGAAYPGTASTFQAEYTETDGTFAFGYAVAPGPL